VTCEELGSDGGGGHELHHCIQYLRIQGFEGLGFRIQGSGFRVQGLRCGGLGLRV